MSVADGNYMLHDEGHVNRLMRGGRQTGWFLGCDGQTGRRREVVTDGWMDGWMEEEREDEREDEGERDDHGGRR
jgi:hypothetical protein